MLTRAAPGPAARPQPARRRLGAAASGRDPHLLPGTPYHRRGYEWWWHSFVARHRSTGQLRPMFIELKLMSPGRGGPLPQLDGQGQNLPAPTPPAYGKVVAGAWGPQALQLHQYHAPDDCQASSSCLEVTMPGHRLSEHGLEGRIEVSDAEAAAGARMSGAGTMAWQLSVQPQLPFSVGPGAGRLMQKLGGFDMYWHVLGMRTAYEGTVWLNDEAYDVAAASSYGYRDKNWGRHYTHPWIWLNCNRFTTAGPRPVATDSSLVVGGGQPRLWGHSLGRHVLVALWHDGRHYQWNFTRFWQQLDEQIEVSEQPGQIRWRLSLRHRHHRIDIDFACDKDKMLQLGLVDPDGRRDHRQLYNGGHAHGRVRLWARQAGGWRPLADLRGSLGGCEYGA